MTSVPKLSSRAWEILLVIDERSEQGQEGRFWNPNGDGRGCDDWCDRLGYFVNISGSGDARIIKSLRDKGLIERHRWKQSMGNEYSSHITEDGRLAIERGMEQGKVPLQIQD